MAIDALKQNRLSSVGQHLVLIVALISSVCLWPVIFALLQEYSDFGSGVYAPITRLGRRIDQDSDRCGPIDARRGVRNLFSVLVFSRLLRVSQKQSSFTRRAEFT